MPDCSPDWSMAARSVMDMGQLFFDGQVELIAKFHDTLYVMEKLIYTGDDTQVYLSLKHKYGNRQVCATNAIAILFSFFSIFPATPEFLKEQRAFLSAFFESYCHKTPKG